MHAHATVARNGRLASFRERNTFEFAKFWAIPFAQNHLARILCRSPEREAARAAVANYHVFATKSEAGIQFPLRVHRANRQEATAMPEYVEFTE